MISISELVNSSRQPHSMIERISITTGKKNIITMKSDVRGYKGISLYELLE